MTEERESQKRMMREPPDIDAGTLELGAMSALK